MLEGLFPDCVITELAAPWMWEAELPDREAAIIENAVEKRRREFTAGRTCARGILRKIGCGGDLAIGKDRHGAPVWPEGIVGSISHADDVCVVSIARLQAGLTSLGVDVEKDTGLDRDLVDVVCDEREKAACFNDPTLGPYRLAKVIFSAKESFYKCMYPVTGTVLDFHDVHIRLDGAARHFTGVIDGPARDGLAEGACLGRVLYAEGHIYTSCTLSGTGSVRGGKARALA